MGESNPACAQVGDAEPENDFTADYCWFDGILEADGMDPTALRAAVAELNQISDGVFSMTFEGSRCSLLAEDRVLYGKMQKLEISAVALRLQKLIDLLSSPIESTLRLSEVGHDHVRETLYAVTVDRVRHLTRERRIVDSDLERAPQPPSAMPAFVTRRVFFIAALSIAALCLWAWHYGAIARILTVQAEQIRGETGVFGSCLKIDFERSWGGYDVHIARGPGYPTSGEQAASGAVNAQSAAVGIVGRGDDAYLRLEDERGTVLASERVSLRPLLIDASGIADCRISGHMAAKRLVIALDDGLRLMGKSQR